MEGSSAFLKLQLPDATLSPASGRATARGSFHVGDPAYRRFMLDQAKRNIELLPDTDGICIDRLDWLRLYNPAGDDGVSWVNGRPARSLYRLWLHLPDIARPADAQGRQGDFRQHDDDAAGVGPPTTTASTPSTATRAGLNPAAALMAFAAGAGVDRQPDPAEPARLVMTRVSALAVFPSAPTRSTIIASLPSQSGSSYLDYSRCWIRCRGRSGSAARCVEAAEPNVKVNLFQTPAGYVLPVTFGGGKLKSVTVRLRNIPGLEKLSAKALHPGVEAAAAVTTEAEGLLVLELQVPLKRGSRDGRFDENSRHAGQGGRRRLSANRQMSHLGMYSSRGTCREVDSN